MPLSHVPVHMVKAYKGKGDTLPPPPPPAKVTHRVAPQTCYMLQITQISKKKLSPCIACLALPQGTLTSKAGLWGTGLVKDSEALHGVGGQE